MLTLTDYGGLLDGVYSGAEVELDPAAWDYFRRVLPPVWEKRPVYWPDGQVECTSFCFADGSGPVIAFYVRWDRPQCRYLARNTGQMI